MALRNRFLYAALVLLILTSAAHADTAVFDLAGPPIDVRVSRAGKTLPISQVPNLMVGDRLWIHPDMPVDQAAHYLMIVVFLRGSTNPPPATWFTRAATWEKKVREEGIFVVVPEGATQAAIFLAPETGGDFNTLRSAVRGRPGSFVRAVQDLNQASLDRSRLDAYLVAIHQIADTEPQAVRDRSALLARSLSIHLEDDCFKRPVDQQPACLTQKGDSLLLNDGHSQSMVGAMTNGAASDLVGQLAYTPQGGSGYFSPYIGAVMDLARILDSLHTAQYQYIPALALPKRDQLETKLNTAPSFHNPKSVLVVALPPVRVAPPPPLHAVDPQQVSCLQKSDLVFQVRGAPLVFSTDLAHDIVLHIKTPTGPGVDLPATPDAARGGYLIDTHPLARANLSTSSVEGVLQGQWGFEPFTGPTLQLQNAQSTQWYIPPAETSSLVVGHPATLHLHASEAACVDQVRVKDQQGNEWQADWKVSKPEELSVRIPLETGRVGAVTVMVNQAGLDKPDQIPLRAYAEPGHLEQFTLSPGDKEGVLQGPGVSEVVSVEVNGIHFNPPTTTTTANSLLPKAKHDELQLSTTSSSVTAGLQPASKTTARVSLKDGRTVDVPATILEPRPRVSLIDKNIVTGADSSTSLVHLTDPDELPQDGQISFSLKSEMPETFPRTSKIEIATEDSEYHTQLSIADGTLTLQDSQTVLATFDPLKSFGRSAFGQLRFRPIDPSGVAGDWQPLAILVRVPSLKELRCPSDISLPCTLSGSNLFLLAEVAADAEFTHTSTIPQGFVSNSIVVPHPSVDKTLYLKLRDNPADINTATLPVLSGLRQQPLPQN